MKILIINYRYFVSGGPEKYMFNLIKLLEEKGHEVFPFSIHSNKNVKSEYSKYFVEPIGGRDVVYFDEVKKNPKTIVQLLSRSIYSFSVKKAVKREIADVKPDLVYIIHFINKLSPSVITAAREMGVPVVLRLSDYFMLCPRFDFLYDKHVCEDCLKKGYMSCIKKKCVKNSFSASLVRVLSMKIHNILKVYNNVDAFVTPSAFLKHKLVQNGIAENRIFCIPTFASGDFCELEYCDGDYGLYFGRITEEKGVETTIHAFERLKDKKLKIMGDYSTSEGKRLIQYIKNRNLNNIEFLGFKSGAELENVIKHARYIIIPSIWYDNLPNTALEAFKHSKAVLASNIGSLPELVVDNINGYLFAPGNVDDLIEKIKLIDDDKKLRQMGRESRKLLETKFSKETHYGKLMNLFENCVNDQ